MPMLPHPHRPIAALLAALLFATLPAAARASCAGAVAGMRPLVTPAAGFFGAVPEGHVGLTFLGHASFLIETPGGVAIVTDYNGVNRAPITPEVVTMNNAHSTHYTDVVEPGVKLVLRGWDPAGGVAHHDVVYGDVHIRNVPTNVRDFGGTRMAGNSIFTFDVADLCIAHLSHLHHTLTREHLAELGQVDVLLVPIDGMYTLSQDDMIEVIEQIHAPLIVPMHYFSRGILNAFLARMHDRYPVRISDKSGVLLSRADLPAQPEILVLPGN
jgi:L-ascorbate metabolism protein UlaG (beta-lactamase superfamily)